MKLDAYVLPEKTNLGIPIGVTYVEGWDIVATIFYNQLDGMHSLLYNDFSETPCFFEVSSGVVLKDVTTVLEELHLDLGHIENVKDLDEEDVAKIITGAMKEYKASAVIDFSLADENEDIADLAESIGVAKGEILTKLAFYVGDIVEDNIIDELDYDAFTYVFSDEI